MHTQKHRDVIHPSAMALLITLILTCAFFSQALTLTCSGCISRGCPNLTCPSHCGSMTTTIHSGGRKVNNYTKVACADPASCVNGSINAGQNKVTLNTQCCNTYLCNTQIVPDLPQQTVNGKQCFTCNGTDCSKTLACEGDETQCFITTAEVAGKKVLTKGCSSKFFCGLNATQVLGLPAQVPGIGVYMKCCEGNMCNGAQRLSVYVPVLVPLLCLLVL